MNGVRDWNSTGRLSPDFFSNMMKINSKLDGMYFELARNPRDQKIVAIKRDAELLEYALERGKPIRGE